ncbi:MAG TPA: hypothetical protein VIT41_12750 [Microlunatus sp.]
MPATATESLAELHIEITRRRRLGAVVMSALVLVAGVAVWRFTSMIGENTGAAVGLFVASIGLTFFFPALQTSLQPSTRSRPSSSTNNGVGRTTANPSGRSSRGLSRHASPRREGTERPA